MSKINAVLFVLKSPNEKFWYLLNRAGIPNIVHMRLYASDVRREAGWEFDEKNTCAHILHSYEDE